MPGQTNPADYMYSGTANFVMNPFTASPAECSVTYSCEMTSGPASYDLCNYTGGTTTTSFDAASGDFSFTSKDFATFGIQTLTFEITGTSGTTTASTSFSLNLIDPCATVQLSTDSSVFAGSVPILYNVYEANSVGQFTLNPSNVELTPDNSDLCPAIQLDVVYDDVKSIDSSIFTFDQATNVFSIDTKNTDYSDTYQWKVIAQFEETYTQTSEFQFIVVLIFYCEFSTVVNPG